jgi:hypothetical protein
MTGFEAPPPPCCDISLLSLCVQLAHLQNGDSSKPWLIFISSHPSPSHRQAAGGGVVSILQMKVGGVVFATGEGGSGPASPDVHQKVH